MASTYARGIAPLSKEVQFTIYMCPSTPHYQSLQGHDPDMTKVINIEAERLHWTEIRTV